MGRLRHVKPQAYDSVAVAPERLIAFHLHLSTMRSGKQLCFFFVRYTSKHVVLSNTEEELATLERDKLN